MHAPAWLKGAWAIAYESVDRFGRIEGPRRAAALAQYALFSIFPALLLAVTIFGFVLGDREATRAQLLDALGSAMTPELRKVLDETLGSMQKNASSRGISAVAGVVGLLFGASGAFIELDSALKRTFRVPSAPTESVGAAIVTFFRERLLGIGLFTAFAAVALTSAVVGVVIDAIAEASPLGAPVLWQLAELCGSVALLTLALGLLFQGMSGRRLRFRFVLPGAAITIGFFYLLKRLFSLYVGKLTSYSAYGVVGTVFVLAAWITLASHVLLLGAQLTEVIAERMAQRRPRGMAGAAPLAHDHGALPRGRA
jgi:membrane protein